MTNAIRSGLQQIHGCLLGPQTPGVAVSGGEQRIGQSCLHQSLGHGIQHKGFPNKPQIQETIQLLLLGEGQIVLTDMQANLAISQQFQTDRLGILGILGDSVSKGCRLVISRRVIKGRILVILAGKEGIVPAQQGAIVNGTIPGFQIAFQGTVQQRLHGDLCIGMRADGIQIHCIRRAGTQLGLCRGKGLGIDLGHQLALCGGSHLPCSIEILQPDFSGIGRGAVHLMPAGFRCQQAVDAKAKGRYRQGSRHHKQQNPQTHLVLPYLHMFNFRRIGLSAPGLSSHNC